MRRQLSGLYPIIDGQSSFLKCPIGTFSARMDKMPKEQVLEYKLAFSQYDRDGNGKISQKELGEAMRSAGEKPSEAQLKQLLKEFDFDGNGTIDFQEYVALVERFWSWK